MKRRLFSFIKTSFLVNIKNFSTMNQISKMAFIENEPEDPVDMFSDLIKAYKTTNPTKPYIPMNLATVDNEFGVLNRTVVYRGLQDGHITFVTENNSIKYANIIQDPRTSITFLFDKIQLNGMNSTWQICLTGKAVELSGQQIINFWTEEPIYAKIRSRICECGKPVEYLEQKKAHDKILKEYESGQNLLATPTSTFTAFKILPTMWDFYKSSRNCIADRLQYCKEQTGEGKWSRKHVSA